MSRRRSSGRGAAAHLVVGEGLQAVHHVLALLQGVLQAFAPRLLLRRLLPRRLPTPAAIRRERTTLRQPQFHFAG